LKRRLRATGWARSFARGVAALTHMATASGQQALRQALRPAAAARAAPAGDGAWLAGVALGATGARPYRLYRPPGVKRGERLPLMVMLHGCGQDASGFASSTRMNRIARRERFLVLYPEQDRLANAQGCWNWFDTDNGRAQAEAASILRAIDQVCQFQAVDPARVAVAGLSAGASMAALLATRYPARFKAVVMHSGVAPGRAHSALSAWGAMRARRPQPPPPARPDVAAGAAPDAAVAAWPPLLVVQGEADAVVSPHNGLAAAQWWAQQAAGAKAGPVRSLQRGQRHPMRVTDFKHPAGTVATLVTVARLGHAWSGGAAGQPHGDAQGPDASRMAWAFAARQFKRTP
jgi:poly(hydroxyalkanoate) depolymerase family esterase